MDAAVFLKMVRVMDIREKYSRNKWDISVLTDTYLCQNKNHLKSNNVESKTPLNICQSLLSEYILINVPTTGC